MKRLTQDIEGWSNALLKDKIWKSLLLMRSFVQKALKASSGGAKDVVLFPLEVFEVNCNDFGFDFNSIEI